jgi:hypothetical protein
MIAATELPNMTEQQASAVAEAIGGETWQSGGGI